MRKQLIVTLRPDGSVAAETLGMAGDECLAYISALEDLLDATTTSSSFTAEYAGVADRATTGLRDEEHTG